MFNIKIIYFDIKFYDKNNPLKGKGFVNTFSFIYCRKI